MLSDDFTIFYSSVIHCDVTRDRELYLPSLYWIPTLHKCTFKQRYFAGFAKCSTKPISKSLIYQQSKPGFRVTVTLAT